jgi:hypothetical protein
MTWFRRRLTVLLARPLIFFLREGNAKIKIRGRGRVHDYGYEQNEGDWSLEFNLLSRDRAIVAWHEVPGTPPPQKSRPVGYDLILADVRSSIR